MNVFSAIKNVLKKISSFFSRLFEKDVVVKITSIIAAIAIWFVISVSEYPIINEVVYNVPIKIVIVNNGLLNISDLKFNNNLNNFKMILR